MISLIYQIISLKFCVTSINRIIVMQITAGLNKIIKIRESAWWGTSRRVTWRPASAKTLQINRIMEATRLLMIYARQCAGNCHRARTRGLCMCVQRLINESTGTRLRPRDDVHTFVTVRRWERWWGRGGVGERGEQLSVGKLCRWYMPSRCWATAGYRTIIWRKWWKGCDSVAWFAAAGIIWVI